MLVMVSTRFSVTAREAKTVTTGAVVVADVVAVVVASVKVVAVADVVAEVQADRAVPVAADAPRSPRKLAHSEQHLTVTGPLESERTVGRSRC